MKKLIAIFLAVALLASLAGCAGTTVVVGNCTCPPDAHTPAETPAETPTDAPVAEEPDAPAAGALKTGLAIVPNISGSAAATAEANGKADYDVTLVAVVVDENGVIQDCVIDSLGTSVAFDAAGLPVDFDAAAPLKTKNELGFDYGMVAYNASAIGKEWFEQAEALATFAQGKTMEEVAGAISGGYASDVDLAASASVYLGGYVSAMEVAIANAKVLGAQAGDELKLAVSASMKAAAGEEAGGAADLTVDAAALTVAEGVITSCTIDSLQANVTFDGTGALVTDVSVAPLTKNQLGFDYGMVAYNASAIGKEWFEQAEAFCAYVTGKTFDEVSTISVDEGTKPTDVDLAAGCSIAIGGFQGLIAKAAG